MQNYKYNSSKLEKILTELSSEFTGHCQKQTNRISNINFYVFPKQRSIKIYFDIFSRLSLYYFKKIIFFFFCIALAKANTNNVKRQTVTTLLNGCLSRRERWWTRLYSESVARDYRLHTTTDRAVCFGAFPSFNFSPQSEEVYAQNFPKHTFLYSIKYRILPIYLPTIS